MASSPNDSIAVVSSHSFGVHIFSRCFSNDETMIFDASLTYPRWLSLLNIDNSFHMQDPSCFLRRTFCIVITWPSRQTHRPRIAFAVCRWNRIANKTWIWRQKIEIWKVKNEKKKKKKKKNLFFFMFQNLIVIDDIYMGLFCVPKRWRV